MAVPRPRHLQLAHPFLRPSIIAAARATTAWEVHLSSFADLLRLIAEEQRRRWPDRVTGFPSSVCSNSISAAAYGFRLLVLRDPDLQHLIPGGDLPRLTYPVRTFTKGAPDSILVIDGWPEQDSSGLITFADHVLIQLDGELTGVEEVAWRLYQKLGVFLDATLRIHEIKGILRTDLDSEGWTAIEGFRRAWRGHLIPSQQSRTPGPFGWLKDFLDEGLV